MNAALRRRNRTSGWIMAAAFAAALTVVGCGDDDDEDYTETYQNCQVADYGGGEQYKLCCTVTCNYHYDDDEYVAQCAESRTCTTATGSACPTWVVQENRYPPCPY
ncbi:MAG: hypothetical protein H6Q33_2384 [Deltaproteobacteria bacterium]|jgi:hypothetical protein|nr:hypothetical protein [Deltaproteobacteria bacterium]